MEQLSKRLQNIKPSKIIVMSQKSRELQAQGVDIINLSIGEPDFDTPQVIKQAGINAINNNYTHYPPIPGFLDVRKAIANKLKKENNLSYTAEEIIISAGTKQAIMNVLMTLVNKGDEVIIPTPAWLSYFDMVKVAEGEIKTVTAGINNLYKITANQLEAAITPRTKVLMLNSPSNPTGSVYSYQELKEIAQVLERHPQVYTISDEIYEYLNYVGKHESIAQFDEIKNRVIVANGVSKGFAMTGWRIGYIAAPEWIVKGCTKLQTQFTSGACAIAQRATLKAYTTDIPEVETMRQAFQKRRDMCLDLLKEIPEIKTYLPEGAFYLLPDVSAFFGKTLNGITISNAEDFSMYLLEKAQVAIVSGTDFAAPNCLRISYATSDENLKKAFSRIKKALY